MQALFTNPSTGEKVSFLYQWETDIDFSFEAKNGTNVEVAFSTIGMKEAIRKDCANTSGDIWTCKIPDTILQYGTNVAAYITYISGNSVRVIDRADITVKKRKKPAGYVSTTDDTWITVEQMLERIEASTKNVETIENNVKSTETEVRKLKEEVEGKVNDFSSVFDNCVIEFELIRQHAVEDVNAAGTTQINAINTAGSEQKKAVEDAGREALNNIGSGVDSSLTQEGKAADAGATGAAIDELKTDLVDHVKESQKSIEDLNDKKITKFYANSLGETTLNDSDNGKIQDMMLYGKSEQKSYSGKNLFNAENKGIITVTDDGLLLNGTIVDHQFISFTIPAGSYFMGEMNGDNHIHSYIDNFDSYMKEVGAITFETDKRLSFYIVKGTYSNMLIKPYIVEGSNPMEIYEPYVGGIPLPNPDYPQEIKSVVNPVVKVYDADETHTKTASLPYTLNAIPVSSGGNVTIDGQQYIADYVDIENKKLHRYVKKHNLGSLNWSINNSSLNIFNVYYNEGKNSSDNSIKANILCSNYLSSYYYSDGYYMGDKTIAYNQNNIFIRDSSYTDITALKNDLSGVMMYFILNTPTITDLTDEEVQAFKDLHTYYPTTNIINSSDQLDGFTTFNYPVSLKNGWEYVKQQISDTREYIYDMELQSAEAFVNSEYAVALAELGV